MSRGTCRRRRQPLNVLALLKTLTDVFLLWCAFGAQVLCALSVTDILFIYHVMTLLSVYVYTQCTQHIVRDTYIVYLLTVQESLALHVKSHGPPASHSKKPYENASLFSISNEHELTNEPIPYTSCVYVHVCMNV